MAIAHQFADTFEAHLTLRPPDDEARLAEWAAANDLRYCHIVLDRGATPDQPMLTFTRSGTLADLLAATRVRGAELAAAGFTVVRAKIEASPHNSGVPRTAAEAAGLPGGSSFEHHVKLAPAAAAEEKTR